MAELHPDPDLYERDFYAWTKVQARALRRAPTGSNVIEWRRIAEEIEDLGKSERNPVRSSLRNIIVHLHLIEASRSDHARRHWAVEIANFRAEVEAHLTASIRRLLRAELETLHAKGAELARRKLKLEEPERDVDPGHRWTLAQILGEADDPLDAAGL